MSWRPCTSAVTTCTQPMRQRQAGQQGQANTPKWQCSSQTICCQYSPRMPSQRSGTSPGGCGAGCGCTGTLLQHTCTYADLLHVQLATTAEASCTAPLVGLGSCLLHLTALCVSASTLVSSLLMVWRSGWVHRVLNHCTVALLLLQALVECRQPAVSADAASRAARCSSRGTQVTGPQV